MDQVKKALAPEHIRAEPPEKPDSNKWPIAPLTWAICKPLEYKVP